MAEDKPNVTTEGVKDKNEIVVPPDMSGPRLDHGNKVAEAVAKPELRYEKFTPDEFKSKWKDFKVLWDDLRQSADNKEDTLVNFVHRLREMKFMHNHMQLHPSAYGDVDTKTVGLDLQSIEDDLRGVQSSVYEALERDRDKMSPRDFLALSLDMRLRLISNIKSWDGLKDKEGTLIVFDFGKNKKLEHQIGLGDLMPDKIRQIELEGTVYTRRGAQGFYDEKGNYLAIFNGTKVTVLEENTSYNAHNEYVSKFGDKYKVKGEKIKFGDEEIDVDDGHVIGFAEEFSVDANLLQAVVGVLREQHVGEDMNDFEFFHMASRYIQNAEADYEITKGKAVDADANHYTSDFISHALSHFNLFARASGENVSRINEVIDSYNALAGLRLDHVDVAKVTEEVGNIEDHDHDSGHHGEHDGGHDGLTNYTRFSDMKSVKNFNMAEVSLNERFVRSADDFGNKVVLRKTAMRLFENAREIAHKKGFNLCVKSSYRSMSDQSRLWNDALAKYDGNPETADNYVARPGGSYHHSGGTIDVVAVPIGDKPSSGLKNSLYSSKLAEIMNSAGFVNYDAEPWHWEFNSARYHSARGGDYDSALIYNFS